MNSHVFEPEMRVNKAEDAGQPLEQPSRNIMKLNCSEKPKDFLGDDLSWEDIAKALWKILDDIDTLPDMLHPSEDKMADKCWRMMVARAEKRHQYLLSDGYTLTKHLPPTKLPVPIDPPRPKGGIKEWA